MSDGENAGFTMRVHSLPGRREQVAERMRLAIATGHFSPGERLIERDLCEKMGVSRTSLREAMRELQADGLITAQPNKGLSVSTVSYETAVSIYQVRAVLEGLAARLFARNASTAQMFALKQSLDRLEDVYKDFSADRFITTKTAFYDILLAGANNPVSADMLRRIHTRVSQLRVVSLSSSARAEKSISELREMMAALEARDEDRAFAVCVAHVEAAAVAALLALKAAGK